MDKRHLTEKLINKLQNLHGIALEQNVDLTVHQLKVILTLGAVYFTIALNLTVNNCASNSAEIPLILGVMAGSIWMISKKN